MCLADEPGEAEQMTTPDRAYETAEQIRGPINLYLVAQLTLPAATLVAMPLASRIDADTWWALLMYAGMFGVLVLYALATRTKPHRWVPSCAVVSAGLLFFVALIVESIDKDAPAAVLIAVLAGVVLLPTGLAAIAVRRLRRGTGDRVDTDLMLTFKLRGERAGVLFIGTDDVRVKIKRAKTGSPDNFSDEVPLSGVQAARADTLTGQATVTIGHGHKVQATDGPVLVLEIVEPGRGTDDREVWQLPMDDAASAADAFTRRRIRLTSKA